jgi:hypothetical protein
MEKIEYIILIFLAILFVITHIFLNTPQKIYFFFDPTNAKSIKVLKEMLKNSSNEIIIVSLKNTSIEHILKDLNKIRPVDKIFNIENMTDLNEIVNDSCYKNAKCIFQPWDKFYSISNRLNVFGYPFNFQNKIDSPSNVASDSRGNAVFKANEDGTVTSGNIIYGPKNGNQKLRDLIVGSKSAVSCSNTRSSRGL